MSLWGRVLFCRSSYNHQGHLQLSCVVVQSYSHLEINQLLPVLQEKINFIGCFPVMQLTNGCWIKDGDEVMECLVAMGPIMSAKFVMVYYLSTGPMELTHDNHIDALGGSSIYFLWPTNITPQRGKAVSGKKGKDCDLRRNLKRSEEVSEEDWEFLLSSHICITSKPGVHLPNGSWGFHYFILLWKWVDLAFRREKVVTGFFKRTAMVGKLWQAHQVCIQMLDNLIKQDIYLIKCWIR